MSMQFSPERMEFQLGTQTSFASRKAKDETPFCIVILADFNGRGNRDLCETGPSLAARQRIAVDVDNLESLPMKLGCEDPAAIVADEAAKRGMKVWYGMGMYGRSRYW